MKLLIPNHTEPDDSDEGSSIHGMQEHIGEDFDLPSSGDEELSNEDIEDVIDHPSDADYDLGDEDTDSEISVEEGSNNKEQLSDKEFVTDDESDDDEIECNANMSDLFGNRPNIEANREHPPNITTDAAVVDVCFHPERELLAAASMDGDCIIYSYAPDKSEEVKRLTHHDKPCRQIGYSEDGTLLYTISKDKSLAVLDAETFQMKEHIKEAHEAPIYSFFPIDNNICATGDDDGLIKLWDLRKQKSVFEFKCGEQTVSAMVADQQNHYLAAAVLDGSITGINLKTRKLETQSELYDTEFVSLSLVKKDSSLVVGTSIGALYFFRWGEFGQNRESMTGHPEQITSQVAITDDTIITGCEDGNLRAVRLHPHRFHGIIGQHDGDFGVENMSVSMDGNLVASCAMDDTIQFWNIEYLYVKNAVRTKRGSGNLLKGPKSKQKKNLPTSRRRNIGDFMYDLKHAPEEEDDGLGPVPSTSYDSDE